MSLYDNTNTLRNILDEVNALPDASGGSGGIEPTASFLTKREISQSIASYPFIPKYKDEIIIWNTTGSAKADNGSITPYAFMLWIVNGKVSTASGGCAWISGSAVTTPWEDSNYSFAPRNATFTFDESGYLNVTTGVWGYFGTNNTMTIYEIPLPIGNGV